MRQPFKRELGSLDALFAFAQTFAADHKLDERTTYAMNLALEEIFTNMVKYGGGDDAVSVGLDVRDGDLVIEFEHSGAVPFDASRWTTGAADRALEDREPGGMGLHLVRRLMDEFVYAYRGGAAHITLTKHLGGA